MWQEKWKLWSFGFLFKEISVMLSGYIAAPCLFYSSLSTDKFISDKRHERKCAIFRRLTQLPSAWVPRKQSCLRNWLMLKAVKQRANSACWKKCLHGFMLSFLCGEAITVRRVRKDHERYLVCPPAQDRKVMCKSIQTLWDIPQLLRAICSVHNYLCD